MRKGRVLVPAAAVVCWAAGLAASACGGDDNTAPGAADAASDAREAAPPVDAPFDNAVAPDDATRASCVLGNGTDPVELCSQKLVLKSMHDAVFTANGVLAGWDANTGAPSSAHDVHDDAAYAAAISAFMISAGTYGDNTLTPTLAKDLAALVPVLEKGLAPPPDEYSGELYAHLRATAVGLRYQNQNADADAIDAIADTLGHGIYAHFVSLGGGDGVLAARGSQDYAPADVATGAYALIDMAARHPSGLDGGADAAPLGADGGDGGSALDAGAASGAGAWLTAAIASLEHLHARARDGQTQMYYRVLTPGGGEEHDPISASAPAPADELTSDVAGTLALALLRSAELVSNNPGPLARIASYPFVDRANEAIASVNGAAHPLWDADNNGYMEGWVPSTQTLVTNKPTRANALLFAAIHRANLLVVVPQKTQLVPLRDVVGATKPLGVGLLTSKDLQTAYFAEVAKDFSSAVGDDGGAGSASYTSAATTIACEGLNEQWIGVPH